MYLYIVETIKQLEIMTKKKKLSKTKGSYQTALIHFRKQFKDVVELTKLYIGDGKVVAGEWIDSNGVVNFNSGVEGTYDTVVKIVD